MLSGVPTSQGMLAAPRAGGSKEQILELPEGWQPSNIVYRHLASRTMILVVLATEGLMISYSGHRKLILAIP